MVHSPLRKEDTFDNMDSDKEPDEQASQKNVR